MQYLQSNQVWVFPSGFRDEAYNYSSKITTEEALTHIPGWSSHEKRNRFFVEDPIDHNYYYLSLSGYVFRFSKTNLTNLIGSTANIYACINLEPIDSSQQEQSPESFGNRLSIVTDNANPNVNSDIILDIAGEFRGLGFATSSVAGDNRIQITDTNGNIVLSPLRFSTDEIGDGNSDNPISQNLTVDNLSTTSTAALNGVNTISGTNTITGNTTAEKINNTCLQTTAENNKVTVTVSNATIGTTPKGSASLSVEGPDVEVKFDSDYVFTNIDGNDVINNTTLLEDNAGDLAAWVSENDTPSWRAITVNSSSNTLVLRNQEGAINAAGIKVDDLANEDSEKQVVITDATGKLEAKSFAATINIPLGDSIKQLSRTPDGTLSVEKGIVTPTNAHTGTVRPVFYHWGNLHTNPRPVDHVVVKDVELYTRIIVVKMGENIEYAYECTVPGSEWTLQGSSTGGAPQYLYTSTNTITTATIFYLDAQQVTPSDYRAKATIDTQPFSEASDRFYGIESDSRGTMYVNVPWKDISITSSSQGILQLTKYDGAENETTTINTGLTTDGFVRFNDVTADNNGTFSHAIAKTDLIVGDSVDTAGQVKIYRSSSEPKIDLLYKEVDIIDVAHTYTSSISTKKTVRSDASGNYGSNLTFNANTFEFNRTTSNPYGDSAQVTINGDLTVTGQIKGDNFLATSDIRKKENIEDYSCEKSILDLPVKKFDYIDGKKNNIGCIAQDLQKICPEIVHEDKDGYLSIEENKLVYLLINEVKKLKEEIDKLKGASE